MTEIRRGLPGDESDEQSRYIEALVSGPDTKPVRVASIYLPNGNPVDSPKYPTSSPSWNGCGSTPAP